MRISLLEAVRRPVLWADPFKVFAHQHSDHDPATIKKRYSKDDSDGVPYGKCGGSRVWHQGHMGDYVCVSAKTQAQAAADNAVRSYACVPWLRP
jgi:hypothetical protein